MAVVDNGTSATLFVSNAGFGVGSPNGNPPVFKQATMLRLGATEADPRGVRGRP
jgi:hypothetical protein